MPNSEFEAVFRAFVKDFGGEILPEGRQRSADYFFRPYNVVGELKCLVVDQTPHALRKLGALISEHRAALPPQPSQEDILHLFTCNERFRRGWGKALLAPIDNLVRHANQQICATKEHLSVPSAHGVVLLFNEGNPLHAHSLQDYMRLVGNVIQKPDGGARRFPHIDGVIYFSLGTVEVFDEQTQSYMPFWFPAQVSGDSVAEVRRFQDDLKKGWYQHVERKTGAPVVSHHRETGWPPPCLAKGKFWDKPRQP
jgi:hypothetical protein